MQKLTKTSKGKTTDKRAAEIQTLKALKEKSIDYADIPPTTPADWRNAVVGKFYRPIKQQLTLRIDADVVDWLKQEGKGYQTRINELLRNAMANELKR